MEDTICSICNKTYSSKSSLLNHRRRFHELFSVRGKDENNCYKCQFCNKDYMLAKSRWAHEKRCNNKMKLTEDENKILTKNNLYLLISSFILIVLFMGILVFRYWKNKRKNDKILPLT